MTTPLSRRPGLLARRLLVRLPVWAVALAALTLGACRQDMHDQPKYETYESSDFWADDASARPIPQGTVARGQLREDDVFYTGFGPDDQPVERIPVPVDERVLVRGQVMFDAFCAPCHDRVGTGQGMVVRRGFKQPSSFHIERLREENDGYFFDVITQGFGQMPSYASQISPEDRWAVVAYVRALQLSQHVPLGELPPQERQRAEAGGPPEVPTGRTGRGPGYGAEGPVDAVGNPPSARTHRPQTTAHPEAAEEH